VKGKAGFEEVKETVRTFLWWGYIFDGSLRDTLAQVQESDRN
jgi:hypothetical protein